MPKLWSSIITVALLAGTTSGVAAQSQEDPTSRPPIPSVGCGTSEVEPGTYQNLSIMVDGVEREWVMLVPKAHDGVTPVPLWLQFHGGAGRASTSMYQVAGVANEHGFVVVAPQGTRTQVGWGNTWMWSDEDTAIDLSHANPDIAFVDALIDHAGERLCIDLARVYAAGYSNGAEAVSVLACALDERIAAVAPVAALFDLGALCDAERPVPHLSVIGTADEWYEGLTSGLGWDQHPIPQALMPESHLDRTAAVAVRNGCQPEPIVEVMDERIERSTWPCPPEADVELVVIEDGGHLWRPGYQLDTSVVVWRFFEQHPMPE